MRYKIVKETKPTLSTFGKYKAKAVHNGEVGSKEIIKEVARRRGVSEGDVLSIALTMAEVINRHLRYGNKVRLEEWGMMKLEIESDTVDALEDFSAKKHIRGVRLHFLPESQKGKPELYQDINYERLK